jgi:hypothetical protein
MALQKGLGVQYNMLSIRICTNTHIDTHTHTHTLIHRHTHTLTHRHTHTLRQFGEKSSNYIIINASWSRVYIIYTDAMYQFIMYLGIYCIINIRQNNKDMQYIPITIIIMLFSDRIRSASVDRVLSIIIIL